MTSLSNIEVFEKTRSALIFEYGPAADQNNVLGLVSGLDIHRLPAVSSP